jgi:hypothetical protein
MPVSFRALWMNQQRRGFDWIFGGTNSRRSTNSLIVAMIFAQAGHILSAQGDFLIGPRFGRSPEKTNLTLPAPPAIQARHPEGPWRPIEQLLPTLQNPLRTFQVDVFIPCRPFPRRLTHPSQAFSIRTAGERCIG